MLFSSIPFLYYFLPLVIALYFIVPFKVKNLVLLIFSLFFYFYGEPVYVLLMLASCLSSYVHGLLIGKTRVVDPFDHAKNGSFLSIFIKIKNNSIFF